MTALLPGAIVANQVDLKCMAPTLIQQGMFRCKAGEYSGLLARYKAAINDMGVLSSFVYLPNVGIAIHSILHGNHAVDVFVAERYRMSGYAKSLMNCLVAICGDSIPTQGLKTQEPTTRLLAQARLANTSQLTFDTWQGGTFWNSASMVHSNNLSLGCQSGLIFQNTAYQIKAR